MELLDNRSELYCLSNNFSLEFSHFARGFFPNVRLHPTILDVNRLFFVLENPGGNRNFILMDDDRVEFRAGYFYFVPAFFPAHFRLDSHLRFISIHFNFEYFRGFDVFSTVRSIYVSSDPELTRRVDQVFASEDLFYTAIDIREMVYKVLLKIIDEKRDEITPRLIALAPYQELFAYLSCHALASMTISDMAERMDMPLRSFSRLFSKDTGMTPKNFLDKQLISRAVRLMKTPHVTSREIAAQLNFSSEYAFSRFFKRMVGASPANYRKTVFIDNASPTDL